MSATLLLYQSFSVMLDGDKRVGGDRIMPVPIELEGESLDLTKSLADDTTWDVWAGADDESALSDFEFLWVESDQDVFLELTVDQNAGVGREEIAITVKAGVPFVMGSSVAKALYTADFAAGTDDVVDRLRVRNESGSTATVRVFMAS